MNDLKAKLQKELDIIKAERASWLETLHRPHCDGFSERHVLSKIGYYTGMIKVLDEVLADLKEPSLSFIPDGYRRVVESSGKPCVVTPQYGRQFLPDDLTKVRGMIQIGGEYYAPFTYLDADEVYRAAGAHVRKEAAKE